HKKKGGSPPRGVFDRVGVEGGKPEPGGVFVGAEPRGLWRQGCVGGEDAPAGVLSGLAAGCHVIAVNAPADTPRLNAGDLVLPSLGQITVPNQPNAVVFFHGNTYSDLTPLQ
ncbi:hypothetical protein KCA24_36650, partial [Escherichia coli]|nr:hypothetical protein [Escherichia coli]